MFGTPHLTRTFVRTKAFTLIELLVVISIIALLIGILMPALAAARATARASLGLSNLRQIGIATASYLTERRQYYPYMSSNVVKQNGTKPRWADYLYPYLRNEQVYLSPNIDDVQKTRMSKLFWHQASGTSAEGYVMGDPHVALAVVGTKTHGGYGWNYQTLGNARNGYNGRNEINVQSPSMTIMVGDTHGSKNGVADGWTDLNNAEGVYVLDAPVGSLNLGSKGNGKSPAGHYYNNGHGSNTGAGENGGIGSGAVVTEDDWLHRATPALRNQGAANMVFADGHCQAMKLNEIDDSNGDGLLDNGHFNGTANANQR